MPRTTNENYAGMTGMNPEEIARLVRRFGGIGAAKRLKREPLSYLPLEKGKVSFDDEQFEQFLTEYEAYKTKKRIENARKAAAKAKKKKKAKKEAAKKEEN